MGNVTPLGIAGAVVNDLCGGVYVEGRLVFAAGCRKYDVLAVGVRGGCDVAVVWV